MVCNDDPEPGRALVEEFTSFGPRVAAFLESHFVGRLATVDAEGRPYVVPVCYALSTDKIFSVIDEKPKDVSRRELKRIRNIRTNPWVCLTVDTYSEDWSELGYVMVRGTASIVTSGEEHEASIPKLQARYRQYQELDFEGRAVIAIEPRRVVVWGRV